MAELHIDWGLNCGIYFRGLIGHSDIKIVLNWIIRVIDNRQHLMYFHLSHNFGKYCQTCSCKSNKSGEVPSQICHCQCRIINNIRITDWWKRIINLRHQRNCNISQGTHEFRWGIDNYWDCEYCRLSRSIR